MGFGQEQPEKYPHECYVGAGLGPPDSEKYQGAANQGAASRAPDMVVSCQAKKVHLSTFASGSVVAGIPGHMPGQNRCCDV